MLSLSPLAWTSHALVAPPRSRSWPSCNGRCPGALDHDALPAFAAERVRLLTGAVVARLGELSGPRSLAVVATSATGRDAESVSEALPSEVASECANALARGSLFARERARAHAAGDARADAESRRRRSERVSRDRSHLFERERFARARAEADSAFAMAAEGMERSQRLLAALALAESVPAVLAPSARTHPPRSGRSASASSGRPAADGARRSSHRRRAQRASTQECGSCPAAAGPTPRFSVAADAGLRRAAERPGEPDERLPVRAGARP